MEVLLSLSEVLEVRACPLKEEELWSLISGTANAIRDVYLKEDSTLCESELYGPMPENLMLCGNGTVTLTPMSYDRASNKELVPPEYEVSGYSVHHAVEKMHIFSLGMTIYSAADNGLKDSDRLDLSDELDQLLGFMCEEEAVYRCTLEQLLQTCESYQRTVGPGFSSIYYIIQMYKQVLGSAVQVRMWSHDTRTSRVSPSSPTAAATSPHTPHIVGGGTYSEGFQTLDQQRTTIHQSRSRSHSRGRQQTEHIHHGALLHPPHASVWAGGAGIPPGRASNLSYYSEPPSKRLQSHGKSSHIRSSSVQPTHSHHTSTVQNGRPNLIYRRHNSLEELDSLRSDQLMQIMQATYERLQARRRRLEAVRLSMQTGHHTGDYSDVISVISQSTVTDVQSLYTDQASTTGKNEILDNRRRNTLPKDQFRRGRSKEITKRSEPVASPPRVPPPHRHDPSKSSSLSPKRHKPTVGHRSHTVSPSKHQSHQERPRKFFGAEFVIRSTEPAMTIIVPQAKLSSSEVLRHIQVVLLNGQRLDVICDPNQTGKELIDAVITHLTIPEHYYFSLAYQQENEFYFLEHTTKLYKIAPPGWRDPSKQHAGAGSFVLYFRVKYYVDSITELKDATTRHLFYLQLRSDILTDRIQCSSEQAMMLAGLALQAEWGDSHQTALSNHGYFQPEHYVSQRLLLALGTVFVRETLPDVHKKHKAMIVADAEYKFMKETQKLQGYGYHYYAIYRSKKSSMPPLYVGLSTTGIVLGEVRVASMRELMQTFSWFSIQKVSFSRRRFSIQPKTDTINNTRNSKLNFFTDSYRKGRYLVHLSTACHRFYIKMKTRVSVQDMFEEPGLRIEESDSEESGAEEEVSFPKQHKQSSPQRHKQRSPQRRKQSSPRHPDASSSRRHHSDDHEPVYYNLPFTSNHHNSTSHTDTSALRSHDREDAGGGSGSREKPRMSRKDVHLKNLAARKPKHDDVSDQDISTLLADTSLMISPTRNKLPIASFDGVALERKITVVDLHKPQQLPVSPRHHHTATRGFLALGVELVGGENTGTLDLGLFIQRMIPESVAQQDGRLHIGDRVIAVNGNSLEGLTRNEADVLVDESSPIVQLMVSQSQISDDLESRSSSISLDEAEVENLLAAGGLENLHRNPAKKSSSIGFVPINRMDSNSSLEEQRPDSSVNAPKRTPSKPPRKPKAAEPVEHNTDDSEDESGSETRNGAEENAASNGTLRSHSAPPSTDIKLGDSYEVVLQKQNGSLGINVTGGVNTSVKYGAIYVKSLIDDGSAQQDGRIHIGDLVLEVDNISLTAVTHKQAVETLRHAPSVTKLVMQRGYLPATTPSSTPRQHTTSSTTTPRQHIHDSTSTHSTTHQDSSSSSHDASSTITTQQHKAVIHADLSKATTTTSSNDTSNYTTAGITIDKQPGYHFVTRGNTYTATIERSLSNPSIGHGISIVGGVGAHSELQYCIPRVGGLHAASPAWYTPTPLAEGDVVISVNNTDVTQLTQQSINSLMESLPDKITVMLCRPEPRDVPDIRIVRASLAEASSTVVAPLTSIVPWSITSTLETSQPSVAQNERNITTHSNDSQPNNATAIIANTEQNGVEQQHVDFDVHNEASEHNRSVDLHSVTDDHGTEPLAVHATVGSDLYEQHEAVPKPESVTSTDLYQQDNQLNQYIDQALESNKIQPSTNVAENQLNVEFDETQGDSHSINVQKMGLGNDDDDDINSLVSINEQYRKVLEPKTPVSDLEIENDSPNDTSLDRSAGYASMGSWKQSSKSKAPLKNLPDPSPLILSEGGASVSDTRLPFSAPQSDDGTSATIAASSTVDQPQSLSLYEATDSQKSVDVLRPGEYASVLVKQDKGLGFTVAGGLNTTGFFYVKDILYDPAKSDERIDRGDRIVKVNGTDIRGLSHEEAVKLLRETPKTVKIRFFKPQKANSSTVTTSSEGLSVKDMIKSLESKKHQLITQHEYKNKKKSGYAASTETSSQLEGEDTMMSTMSSFGDITIPMPTDTPKPQPHEESLNSSGVLEVELTKSASGSLGFSLIQGELGSMSALYLCSITTGGIAHQDNNLRVGDRLLQVNGVSVIGMAHNKAVALIKNAPSKVKLVVTRSANAERKLTLQYNTDYTTTRTPTPSANPTPQPTAAAAPTPTGAPLHSEMSQPTYAAHPLTPHGDHADRSYMKEDSSYMKDSEDDLEDVQPLPPFTDEGAGIESEGEESWIEPDTPSTLPFKPSKSAASVNDDPVRRLPAVISDAWLDSLPLVTPDRPLSNYKGKLLHQHIINIQNHISRNEHVEEFKSLRHAKLTDNCTAARRPENKVKNRYRNVLPYDATRVQLAGPDDYINASHIRINVAADPTSTQHRELRHYIACQGPLPSTASDLWRLVWERRIQVIAMVTMATENGKVKCHQYWPDSVNDPFIVSDRIEVSLTQVQSLENFDIHHIKLEDRHSGDVHRLMHLNFTTWPDHGTPHSGLPLIKYIRLIHLVHTEGPLLVHCSAGIGRTGAFITLDVALSMIEHDRKFDVKKIVMDLRRQRQGMIQTKDQYIFCYKTILEVLNSLKSKDL